MLHRGPTDGPLPPDVFVRVRHPPRRPKQEYRVRIRTPRDAEVARRRKLGMYVLTGEVPTRFHYPMHFPPVLMVDPQLAPLVDTPLRTVLFHATEALHQEPPFEALVTMMLRVDEIAARVMLVRNPGFDAKALTRYVVGEKLERQATRLRFQQFAQGIPVIGEPLPIAAVRQQDRKNLG